MTRGPGCAAWRFALRSSGSGSRIDDATLEIGSAIAVSVV
jgi:hypothetical protein